MHSRLFQASVAATDRLIALEDEARRAMGSGRVATGPVPNFLPNLYLNALLAVRPEPVTVLRWRRARA